MKISEKEPYDLAKDPAGLMQWKALADQFSGLYKVELTENKKLNEVDRIDDVVLQIIEQFRHLIEEARMNRIFFVDQNPRHERFAQLLFYAIAASYCEANKLDISPESDAGAGPVDFKLSVGKAKVLVEIKLSTNGQAVKGYRSQLDAYLKSEKASLGHYVLIDVGKLGNKWDKLTEAAKSHPKFAEQVKLHLIDGTLKESASKRL